MYSQLQYHQNHDSYMCHIPSNSSIELKSSRIKCCTLINVPNNYIWTRLSILLQTKNNITILKTEINKSRSLAQKKINTKWIDIYSTQHMAYHFPFFIYYYKFKGWNIRCNSQCKRRPLHVHVYIHICTPIVLSCSIWPGTIPIHLADMLVY